MRPSKPHPQLTEWLRLYKAGLTTGQIAKEFKVTPSTVRLHLKTTGEFDSSFRPRAAVTEEQKARMVELLKEGYSRKQIGELLGLGATAVQRNLNLMGYVGLAGYRGEPPKDRRPDQLQS